MAVWLIHMIFLFELAFVFETEHRDNALKSFYVNYYYNINHRHYWK